VLGKRFIRRAKLFLCLKKGNIYKEKDIHAEIVEKYIEEEFFLFSYEKDG
jgi:hypothetical protein